MRVCAQMYLFPLLFSALILDLRNTSITSSYLLNKEPRSFFFTPQSLRLTSMSTSSHPHSQSLHDLYFIFYGEPLVTMDRTHLSLTPSTASKKKPKRFGTSILSSIWSLPWREPRRIRVQKQNIRSLRQAFSVRNRSQQTACSSIMPETLSVKWCDGCEIPCSESNRTSRHLLALSIEMYFVVSKELYISV